MPMLLTSVSPDQALLIGRAVFLVFCFALAAITFTRWRRASEHTTDLFFAQNTALLQRLGALEEQLTATRTELEQVRSELRERALDETSRAAAPPITASSTPSYQIAIRLARSGAAREELMSGCGLTRQEAELVQRLHGRPARTAAVATG